MMVTTVMHHIKGGPIDWNMIRRVWRSTLGWHGIVGYRELTGPSSVARAA